jgi:GNAT superfamily N-acetyltransferase
MPGVRVAAIEEPDGAVVDEVLALEAVAFPEHLRYSRDDICARFSRKAARLIAVRRDGALVAFALCYVMPAISWEDLFVDDLAVQPDLQSKGAGSALVLLIADLALIRGFRGVYVSAEILPDLTRFYERLGFWRVAAAPGIGQVLRRPLGLVTPDGASAAVGSVQREVEQRLGQHFSRPRATFHSTLDPDLLKVLLQLEAAFPDDLRYGEDAFGLRMRLPDAFILVLWEQSEPIAYCLSFNDPSLPAHAITIDSVVVRRELRGRGIGRALMRAALTLPTQAHYTIALLTCRSNSPEGVDLVAFYRSFGAEEIGRLRGEIQMRIPLRIGADTAEAPEPTPVRGEPAEAAE